MTKIMILAFVLLSCTAKTEPVIITDDDGNIILMDDKAQKIILAEPYDCTSFMVDSQIYLTTCHGSTTPIIDESRIYAEQ